MPDGEINSTTADSVNFQPTSSASVERFMRLSPVDDQGAGSSIRTSGKDPRRIARKYQLELCEKALEENIIVYLGTGCGKTHIAILLIYEMGHLIRRPQKGICVFLAPTVALVQQQAKVIEDSIDFKVKVYCGGSKCLNSHYDWEREMEEYEVFVMTPEILLRNLHHCYIKMEFVELLIFDECHHAQVKSDHSYAEIMRVFYKANEHKRPRIFGMTASPVVGKGACNQQNLSKSINSLEKLLDAKVYSVEDREELEAFVSSPRFKIYYYGPVATGSSSSFMTYCCPLEDVKCQCIVALGQMKGEHEGLLATKKLLCRMHKNIIFCLENLGVWGALQASKILLSEDNSEQSELIEAAAANPKHDSISDRYLNQAAEIFASGCKIDAGVSDMLNVDILKEPCFSKKLLRLIGILSSFRHRPNMKCIIFVNRIVIARSLSYILQNLKFLAYWKCDFLVGVHSKLRSMSRKTMNHILTKFRSGELNLLIATKVGEEGLDIQTCCLVIRFDLPETVSSFIQSRGRARMPQSEYAFLVDSGNEKELGLIDEFHKDEKRMNREISSRSSVETFDGHEESIYRVVSTGASVTSGRSISLLHEYCSKLPHDTYFDPKPKFFYCDDLGGTICHAILPSNAPIPQIVSRPQPSGVAAKKDACLKAVEELHKLGALSDYLLPMRDNANEGELELDSDSDSSEDETSRRELHEMISPAAFKESWTGFGYVILYCYHIKFTPNPEDRIYKEFGLFVKAPLPQEAVRMDLELHLAHGRSVKVNLMPSRVVELMENEITQAECFQEMFLKVILDRSEFVHDYIPLRNNVSRSISSTSYLLLPVIVHDIEGSVFIDWKVIRRCLSSQIFQNHACSIVKETASSDTHLMLYDGRRRSSDIENSLVYVPYKREFFFVTNIVRRKNGYSQYKDSGSLSHFEHLKTRFGIHLKYPEQPLLCAKPLFSLHNLLHNRKQKDSEAPYLEEYFIDIAPELCQLKITGFSKDIGSSISLLPSIMHRLENLLVAIELKCMLAAAFPAGAEVTANRILEALTTEKCQERLSLERLEILGDSFLKFAVARYLFLAHDKFDEGELTRRRSYLVKNINLFKLATRKNLQVYIRDQPFEPSQFYLLGRPCPRICNEETRNDIHSHDNATNNAKASETKCSKGHHWLQKKTISDVVEALVGAFLVDSGFKAAIAFLKWIGIKVEFEASQVTNALVASKAYVLLADTINISALQSSLGHKFLHKGLLLQALVHPTYHKHGGGCYQRLEFLGDAVLDYLIMSYLYSAYPKLKPGLLTDLRSVFVRNEAFANVAVDRFFYKFLLCDSASLQSDIKSYVDFIKSPPSERDSLEQPRCPKPLGDLVESSVGAVLVDTGFDMNYVWKIMLSFLDPIMSSSGFQLSPIRDIIEVCQNCGWKLQFNPSKMEKYYSVEAEVKGDDFHATASAVNRRKKDAEKIAANSILRKLKAQGFIPEVNSLEKILKSSEKMKPKLIGYDETPSVTMDRTDDGLELSGADFDPRVHHEVGNSRPFRITRMSETLASSSGAAGEQLKPSIPLEGHDSSTDLLSSSSSSSSSSSGQSGKTTARSRLYEACAINHWNHPSFNCMNEEGPSHLKMFTYKVVLEIEEAPDTIFEFFGAPHLTKKAAAEHAAEAALWYLKKERYLDDTD